MENKITVTLEEIKREFFALKSIMSNCKTVSDARQILKENRKEFVDIEIGYDNECGITCTDKRFDNADNSKIKWFRVEIFGCLDYIYFFTDGRNAFDVFDKGFGGFGYEIITDANIENIERYYNEALRKATEM